MENTSSIKQFPDINIIKEMIEIYSNSIELPLFLIDSYGNKIFSYPKESNLCKFIESKAEGKNCCTQTHLRASKQAIQLGETYIFTCPSGFVYFSAPLIENQSFKGAIIVGPILLQYPDKLLIDNIMKKFDLNIYEKNTIKSYVDTIPVVEPSKVTYLSKLLFLLTINLISNDKNILYERKERLKQQSKINESIQSIKDKNLGNKYPYDIEKELILRVKNKDELGAKKSLNELLGYIFFASGGNMEDIQTHIIELIALLSRAVVDGGADRDRITKINNDIIIKLRETKNLQDISYWTTKALNEFTENVLTLNDSKNSQTIKKAINYINKNYMNNISLDKVSSYVHLNSSYFSTMFKKELGMSFTNYLNKVRIENSKALLSDLNYTILDIAIIVGFDDQSYYSRVFKKLTGKTPKEYRNNSFG
ncbi:PocR ligand-binding domain-containing protein [Clostridium sediminicola]|uniref:PocR ligand-binding domain-containing protein n=1 Tax=Clostridium sediminicola TaxID=3114879 RepID=UPI0031F1ECA1